MRRILTAAIFIGFATTAFGADMPIKAPVKAPIMPVFTWTGFYAGGQIGGGWGTHDRALLPPGVFTNSYNSSGVVGGVYAGYNWQMQSVVFGIEADVNGSGVKGDDGGAGGTTDESSLKWLGAVRGRIGFAFNQFLIYGTGGWAFGSIEHTNSALPVQSFTNSRNGWTVGGGLEYAFNRNWSGRIDYRYVDLGTYTNAAPTNGVLPYEVENQYNIVTVGIAYRF